MRTIVKIHDIAGLAPGRDAESTKKTEIKFDDSSSRHCKYEYKRNWIEMAFLCES